MAKTLLAMEDLSNAPPWHDVDARQRAFGGALRPHGTF
jgi:hypothetical protein